MRYLYMIVIGSNFSDPNRLHSFIENNKDIPDWWHYLDTVYMVYTTISVAKMEPTLHQLFPSDFFFVIDINPKHYSGWLPKDAWDWLRKFKDVPFHFQQ